MKLRKQLLLASTFTLCLPWVGCQYIQEVESAFLEAQNDALLTTAQALRSTIERDDALIQELQLMKEQQGDVGIYLHTIDAPMRLDGYKEEWENQNLPAQQLLSLPDSQSSESSEENTNKAKIWASKQEGKAWFFVDIPHSVSRYFRPGENYLECDQLRLSLINQNTLTHYRILTSSPGQAQVYFESDNPPYSSEHRIKALWRESASGYRVELSMPADWVSQSFGIEVLAKGYSKYTSIGLARVNDLPSGTSHVSQRVKDHLGGFNIDGTKLFITNNSGAYLGSFGDFESRKRDQQPWFMRLFFDFVLGKHRYPPITNPEQMGFFRATEVTQSLAGSPSVKRYQHQQGTITSASVPIHGKSLTEENSPSNILGALVAVQNTNSVTSFTDSAMGKLLMVSFLVLVGSALSLALYASWLSLRIVKLKNSVTHAISENGVIHKNFQPSQLNDEIGDLSRSYSNLLSRLHEYTDYLKTLSNKLNHELRTPLAIIGSSLDNLDNEIISPEAKVYSDRAKDGAKRLSQILNAMGAASRVEQAVTSTDLRDLDLVEVLPALTLAYSDAYTNSQFQLEMPEQLQSCVIKAAEDLFVQMLDKLVDNAVDFCNEGETIQIQLEIVEHSSARDPLVRISIANPGPLLPKEMTKDIFESMVTFRENTHTTDTAKHHLGLGLYIARLIAQLHKGRLRAESLFIEDGASYNGARFSIELPLENSPSNT